MQPLSARESLRRRIGIAFSQTSTPAGRACPTASANAARERVDANAWRSRSRARHLRFPGCAPMSSPTSPAIEHDASRDRRRALRLLSLSTSDELERAWDALDPAPEVVALRGPEVGLVMARGRIGGDGNAFNLGEVAVARATVRLAGGAVGFGHVLGTDERHAWLAAAFDALGVAEGDAAAGRGPTSTLLGRIEARLAREHRVAAEEAAATRVDFFTMTRGEDDQ